ncbi:MAG: nitroreductase [Clostridiales bacterium]|nr:nitroreductase [Clostridiales bacterium]
MIKNETLETLKTRRSCRAYKPELITDEQLETILEAGEWAPSGMGKQSAIMIAVQNKDDVAELERINAEIFGKPDSHPFYGAPTVVVVLADTDKPTAIYDGSLVMGNLMNAAASIGVDCCWIHRAKETFEREDGKALLKKWGIEGNYIGIGNCILGYAAQEIPAPAPRKENYITIIK